MKKVLTIVLSGLGYSEETTGNAVYAAKMTNFNEFWNKYPHTTLFASGDRLGLDSTQMGNSALAHLAMGSGRLLKNDYERVNDFLNNYKDNEVFSELLVNKEKRVHLVGLCSDGNIHSSIEHLKKMYEILVNEGFNKIFFHLITDGRDVSMESSLEYINSIKELINEHNVGSIATVCGRYFAMDRDLNYELTKIYYDLITQGEGTNIINIDSAINACYKKELSDETIRPFVLDEKGIIHDDDIMIWMNYRAERSKQILQAFADNHFNKFSTVLFTNLKIYSFFPVDKNIKITSLIDNVLVDNSFGVYLSKLGITQARIAETDKFPHVTYFFDGCYNGKIDNCDKYQVQTELVDDLEDNPAMNAAGVTKKIIDAMEKDYSFILATYANVDSLGHTGDFDSTVNACKIVDKCLEKLIEAAEDNFYTLVLISDQGNAEMMLNEDGTPSPTHSLSKVPFVVGDSKVKLEDDGDLTNFAPTILDYMDISIPLQMTSKSLIK